ncbi:MAG: hypothetical protein PHQ35_11085 [Phycisphaerae bacterium]|nr:hypothetical protein [Phycisphaerae bacterium]
MKCPVCDGTGKTIAFLDGYKIHKQKIIPCGICDGTGECDDGYPERRKRGHVFHMMRVNKSISLRSAAKQLNRGVVELSHMECGRVEPDFSLYESLREDT